MLSGLANLRESPCWSLRRIRSNDSVGQFAHPCAQSGHAPKGAFCREPRSSWQVCWWRGARCSRRIPAAGPMMTVRLDFSADAATDAASSKSSTSAQPAVHQTLALLEKRALRTALAFLETVPFQVVSVVGGAMFSMAAGRVLARDRLGEARRVSRAQRVSQGAGNPTSPP